MKAKKDGKEPKNGQPFWTAKAGSVRVKVYEVKTGPARQYTVFCVSDYSTGKRRLRKFSDLATAKSEAQRIAIAIANGDVVTASVTTDDAVTLSRARQTIAPLGLTLDTAAEILAKAAGLVGIHHVVEACVEFAKRYPKGREPLPLPKAIDEFIGTKRADKCSDRHLNDLRHRLGRFNVQHPGKLLSDFTTGDLQRWINSLAGLNGKALSASSRRSFATVIGGMFDFHRSLGAIAENPMVDVKRAKIRHTGNTEFWKPEETAKLLAAASAELVAPLAIALFSGLRSAEVCRITWADVKFEQAHIVIEAGTAKTASRRLAPLPTNLAAWLTGRRGKASERVWSHLPDTFADEVTAACKRAGIRRVVNGARHSFVSYRVALSGDVTRVALEAGNSPAVVHRHYRGLTTESEAKSYFAIEPTRPGNVVSLQEVAV